MFGISRHVVLAGLALTVLSLNGGCGSEELKEEPERAADLVVLHGRVYTFSWSEPSVEGEPAADAPHDASGWHADAEAVAVRDGEIVFRDSMHVTARYVSSIADAFSSRIDQVE